MKATRRTWIALALIVAVVGGAQQWWAQRQAGQIGAQVAALAQPGDIRMLSSQTCGICASARAWFQGHAIAYSECTIETDAACRQAYEALGAPGTPVIQVRGRNQLGFSPERLQTALQRPLG